MRSSTIQQKRRDGTSEKLRKRYLFCFLTKITIATRQIVPSHEENVFWRVLQTKILMFLSG